MRVCGILFPDFGGCTKDASGCLLDERHEGPHQFKTTHGELYQWETDLDCPCCADEDPGDWCATYWPAPKIEIPPT